MSTFGQLYVGRTGLQVSQEALNTTAHNLSNVGTEGYTRQQVYFAELEKNTIGASCIGINMQQAGLGVTYSEVRQVRDYFLDRLYRLETGRNEFYNVSYNASSEVETLLGELEGVAFQSSLQELRVAFDELSKMPDENAYQSLVILKGSGMLERAQDVYQGLKQYQMDVNKHITDSVDRINEIAGQIIKLNRTIYSIEGGDTEKANDYRDTLNKLIDELGTYGKVEAKTAPNGMMNVSFEDEEFIKGARFNEMGTRKDKETGFIYPVWLSNSDVPNEHYQDVFNMEIGISTLRNTDIGSMKGYVFARGLKVADYTDVANVSQGYYNDEINISVMTTAQAEFDQLIHNIVTKINDILCPNTTVVDDLGNKYTVWDESMGTFGSTGHGPGEELFIRASVPRYEEKTIIVNGRAHKYYVYNEENLNDKSTLYTLDSLRINDKMVADESLLPHLYSNGAVSYDVAKELATAFDDAFTTLNPNEQTLLTIDEYYQNMVDMFATTGSAYLNKSQTIAGTVEAVTNKRTQVVGVSSDEELTNMIKFQNAYNASSRYINVVDEMIEHLITQMG